MNCNRYNKIALNVLLYRLFVSDLINNYVLDGMVRHQPMVILKLIVFNT